MYDFVFGFEELTSFQVLSICDLLMLGYISLKAMVTYVEINTIMRVQADILLQARHGILNPQSKLMDMTDDELDRNAAATKETQPASGKGTFNIKPEALAAAEFLSHLSEVIRVDDYVQTMFDVEVTAFNVAQAVLGLVAGVGSAAGVLYEFMIKAHSAQLLTY